MRMPIVVSVVAVASLVVACPAHLPRRTKVDFSGDDGRSAAERLRVRTYGEDREVQVNGWSNRRATTRSWHRPIADSTGSRFPLAVLSDVRAADVDVSVPRQAGLRPGRSGRGPRLALPEADNYYLVRANALENNVVVYKVENGKRTDLPVKGEGRTYGQKVTVPSGQWSTLRIVASGPLIEVHFNGAKLYEVEDTTFPSGGPGRRLDQGRFGDAVRRPDRRHEVGRR